jgi:hypothetical protein
MADIEQMKQDASDELNRVGISHFDLSFSGMSYAGDFYFTSVQDEANVQARLATTHFMVADTVFERTKDGAQIGYVYSIAYRKADSSASDDGNSGGSADDLSNLFAATSAAQANGTHTFHSLFFALTHTYFHGDAGRAAAALYEWQDAERGLHAARLDYDVFDGGVYGEQGADSTRGGTEDDGAEREGALRVWWWSNRGLEHHAVNTPNDAAEWLERRANRDLRDKRVKANTGGLEVFEDGEWCEWYSADGEDIDEYAEWLSNLPTGDDGASGNSGGMFPDYATLLLDGMFAAEELGDANVLNKLMADLTAECGGHSIAARRYEDHRNALIADALDDQRELFGAGGNMHGEQGADSTRGGEATDEEAHDFLTPDESQRLSDLEDAYAIADSAVQSAKAHREAIATDIATLQTAAWERKYGLREGDDLLATEALERNLRARTGWSEYSVRNFRAGTHLTLGGLNHTRNTVSIYVYGTGSGTGNVPIELAQAMRAAWLAANDHAPTGDDTLTGDSGDPLPAVSADVLAAFTDGDGWDDTPALPASIPFFDVKYRQPVYIERARVEAATFMARGERQYWFAGTLPSGRVVSKLVSEAEYAAFVAGR